MADLVPMSSVTGELTLLKESWLHGDYQLVGAEGQLVAGLDYRMSGRCEARTTAGAWRLSQTRGFLHRRIEVATAEGLPVGRVELRSMGRGGTFVLDDAVHELHAKGWRRPRWSVLRDGQELVVATQTGTLKKAKATVLRAGADDLLTVLLLHVMLSSDAETATAAGATTVVAAG